MSVGPTEPQPRADVADGGGNGGKGCDHIHAHGGQEKRRQDKQAQVKHEIPPNAVHDLVRDRASTQLDLGHGTGVDQGKKLFV